MLREVTLFELKRVAFIFLVCIWGMNDPDIIIIIIIVLVNDDLAMVPRHIFNFHGIQCSRHK